MQFGSFSGNIASRPHLSILPLPVATFSADQTASLYTRCVSIFDHVPPEKEKTICLGGRKQILKLLQCEKIQFKSDRFLLVISFQ